MTCFRSVLLFASTWFCVNLSSTASAGFIMSISNTSLTAGGASATVDVSIAWSATGGEPATIDVDYFIAEFQIVPVGTVSTAVEFRAYEIQNQPGQFHNGNLEQSDADYLFHDNSLIINFAMSSGTLSPGNTVFTGSDGRFQADPNNLVALTSTPRLLYRFEVLATGTTVGIDHFQLQLVNSSDKTQFFDVDNQSFSLDSTSGDIFVTQGITPVPEPSSSFVMLAGVGLMAVRRRGRG